MSEKDVTVLVEKTGKEPSKDGNDRVEVPKSLIQKKAEFETIVKHYLESNPYVSTGRKSSELEIRFGTNTKLSRPISKIDYDNVIKQLYAHGFVPEHQDGTQLLRISCEYVDPRSGQTRMSNIRAEIVGTDLIQEYCRTNSLQRIIDMPSTVFNKLKFTQKMTAMDKAGVMIKRLDMDDFNFRVSYQTEQDYNIQSSVTRNIVSRWADSKKMFRSMNRTRFKHPIYPIFADLSIVKMPKQTNRISIPHYTIQEAGVFNTSERYEIELEVDNGGMGSGSPHNSLQALMDSLRKCIRIVLSGLQGTKYPISYVEKDTLLQSYMRLIHAEKYDKPRRVFPSDFVGPSSVTLQIGNIQPVNPEVNINSICKNYTVTDKADGERKLLYIAEDGKIYMIDTNMNVIFTGVKTADKTIFDSLLDGEHIKYDKNNNFINLYAAFDVYFISKKSVRDFAFLRLNDEDPDTKYRLPLLQKLIFLIKPVSVMTGGPNAKQSVDFTIRCKNFYYDTDQISIFDCCSRILTNMKDGLFEYNTDGLIFTPSDLAVSAIKVGSPAAKMGKAAWDKSFKWKPPEFNTIDFLVSTKKDKTGKDEVHHIFQEGRNLQGVQDILQYKTLVLRCGFDENKHGFLNPFQDVVDDKLPTPEDLDNENTYKPVPFQPTEPFDPNACFCNIMLKEDGSNLFMMTEDEEFFEEDMIVEFKYIQENEIGWRWVPLRVRYDKTSELRSGQRNYGNPYHVANNNWHSIHNPITEEMISTGENIPEFVANDDVYYNRLSNESNTRALRNFHNLFVKKKLIMSVSSRGDTLIDYAVGKAGDLSKWIDAKLAFVFGVDISKDNIENQKDGACTRFLKERRNYGDKMPYGLFVNGNSGLNIRNGKALYTEKERQITNAVFGKGPKDATLLGKGVYRQYGIAEQGFNVSSCQFAVHYFFENKTSFHEFLRNIAECTKVNGYFIGTCYDGKTVFDLLRKYKKDESMTIFKNESKIFELTKMYDQTGFPDDEMSLGYAINVYQESINLSFREYLVNFDYLVRVMEDYGFILPPKEEIRGMDLPDSAGLFRELYTNMENEIKRNRQSQTNYRQAADMSPEEKQISFLNRYFIFKKVRNVDAKKMNEVILKQNELLERNGEETMSKLAELAVDKDAAPVVISKIKGPKLVIKKPTIETKVGDKDKDEQVEQVAQKLKVGEGVQPLKLKIRQKPQTE
jgi:hypothetical protein